MRILQAESVRIMLYKLRLFYYLTGLHFPFLKSLRKEEYGQKVYPKFFYHRSY